MKKKTSLLLGLLALFVVSTAQVQAHPCDVQKMQPASNMAQHQQFNKNYHKTAPSRMSHRNVYQPRPALLGAHVNIGSFFIGFNF